MRCEHRVQCLVTSFRRHDIPGEHSTGSPLVKTSCSNGQEVDSADPEAVHCCQRDRSSSITASRLQRAFVAAGHRGWKAHRPNTQTIGIRGHNFLEVRRLDHFPNTAGSTPIWCDHEGVAAHIWLGLPISDHAQLEMVDLDVVQDWKAVIDRGPSRRVRGAGSPGRGDSAAGSIASQRPRGGSAFFSMKLRPALAADQCRRQRREPPSEGAATRSIWTRGKPMLLFAGPENGCARHHPPRTAAKFNARPRTSSSAANLCFHDGQTMG